MQTNKAFAIGMICLWVVGGLFSAAAAQDRSAATQPAAAAGATTKPAPATTPTTAPGMVGMVGMVTVVTAEPTTNVAPPAPLSATQKAQLEAIIAKLDAATAPAAETKPAAATASSPTETKPAGEPAPVAKTAEPAPTTKAAEPPKPAAKKLDAFVHGKTVTAAIDQDIVLELKGPAATPWEMVKLDGASLQQVGKIEFKATAEGAKDGVYTATFKGVKEGKATVQLQRLIEAGKKDKMEIKFTVTVAAVGA